MRGFRFAVRLNHQPSVQEWRVEVREAEALGYDAISVCDHLDAQWGPMVALATAAECTTTLRLSTGVLNNDLRHPVVLAKEAATLDLISAGRVELGLGAGWKQSDYDQLGWTMDPPSLRIARLEEAAEVVRRCWTEDSVTFDGEHYRLVDAAALPKPYRQPGPAICIGGGGKRVLAAAARRADIVGFNRSFPAGRADRDSLMSGMAASFDERVGWVREAAGTRWGDLELQCDTNYVAIGRRQDGLARLSTRLGIDMDLADGLVTALIGDVDEVCEELEARRERWGFSYWIIDHDAMRDFAPVVAMLAGR